MDAAGRGVDDEEDAASEAPKKAAAEDAAPDELDERDEVGNWANWSCTRFLAWSIADAQLDCERAEGVAMVQAASGRRAGTLRSTDLGSLGAMVHVDRRTACAVKQIPYVAVAVGGMRPRQEDSTKSLARKR